MGVLLVLAILITVILLILLLLWRKQYRTKQLPIDNPTYQGEHSSFSLNYRGSPIATKVTGRLCKWKIAAVNKKLGLIAQECLLLINGGGRRWEGGGKGEKGRERGNGRERDKRRRRGRNIVPAVNTILKFSLNRL